MAADTPKRPTGTLRRERRPPDNRSESRVVRGSSESGFGTAKRTCPRPLMQLHQSVLPNGRGVVGAGPEPMRVFVNSTGSALSPKRFPISSSMRIRRVEKRTVEEVGKEFLKSADRHGSASPSPPNTSLTCVLSVNDSESSHQRSPQRRHRGVAC